MRSLLHPPVAHPPVAQPVLQVGLVLGIGNLNIWILATLPNPVMEVRWLCNNLLVHLFRTVSISSLADLVLSSIPADSLLTLGISAHSLLTLGIPELRVV